MPSLEEQIERLEISIQHDAQELVRLKGELLFTNATPFLSHQIAIWEREVKPYLFGTTTYLDVPEFQTKSRLWTIEDFISCLCGNDLFGEYQTSDVIENSMHIGLEPKVLEHFLPYLLKLPYKYIEI